MPKLKRYRKFDGMRFKLVDLTTSDRERDDAVRDYSEKGYDVRTVESIRDGGKTGYYRIYIRKQ